MTILFRPIAVDTTSGDQEGQLVVRNDKLIAVLVKLSSDHGELSGRWFVEKGFGAFNGPGHPTFASLQLAEQWFRSGSSATRKPK